MKPARKRRKKNKSKIVRPKRGAEQKPTPILYVANCGLRTGATEKLVVAACSRICEASAQCFPSHTFMFVLFERTFRACMQKTHGISIAQCITSLRITYLQYLHVWWWFEAVFRANLWRNISEKSFSRTATNFWFVVLKKLWSIHNIMIFSLYRVPAGAQSLYRVLRDQWYISTASY